MGSGMHNGITWANNLVGMETEKDKAKEKLYADFSKPVDLWRKMEESEFSIFN